MQITVNTPSATFGMNVFTVWPRFSSRSSSPPLYSDSNCFVQSVSNKLRSLLFGDVTLASYWCFRLTYWSYHQRSSSLLGLLDIPEEQIPHLHCGGSLKLHIVTNYFIYLGQRLYVKRIYGIAWMCCVHYGKELYKQVYVKVKRLSVSNEAN